MPSFKLKSSWVTILQGVEFSIFLLILAWALQQCSATALPVIMLQVLWLCFYCGHSVYNIHRVPEKKDRWYFGGNFDKFRQLFTIFRTHHPHSVTEKL